MVLLRNFHQFKGNTMLEQELKYFIKNQKKFLETYLDKYIVIKNNKIIGVYDNELEAYTKTKNTEKLGTFLIQHCIPGKEAYTHSFHSVVFI